MRANQCKDRSSRTRRDRKQNVEQEQEVWGPRRLYPPQIFESGGAFHFDNFSCARGDRRQLCRFAYRADHAHHCGII